MTEPKHYADAGHGETLRIRDRIPVEVVPFGPEWIADRYTYIPLIGLFLAILLDIARRIPQIPQGRKIAALAAPSLTMMAPNMALKTAARDLYSKMQEARMQAIKQNESISVRVGNSFYYTDSDDSDSYTPSAIDTFTDSNGDGAYNLGEPFNDVDGTNAYSGEIAINFNDYGHGIDLGTGNAAKNWNNNLCSQAAEITFNSRGTSNSGSVFLENRNQDISYAVSVRTSGSIKTRKYSGATPFHAKYWN